MKKSVKVIFIVFAVLVAAYALFVTADCIRLSKPGTMKSPLITIGFGDSDKGEKIKGLGYTVEYYIDYPKPEAPDDVTVTDILVTEDMVYGAEIRLFDKIHLWAYVTDKNEELESAKLGEVKWVKIPQVMVGGKLYFDTGFTVDMAGCGVMDGEITSSVEEWASPKVNDQSNFGKGYGYQFGPEKNTITVFIDDKRVIFATEEKRAQLQPYLNKSTAYISEQSEENIESITNLDAPALRKTKLPNSYYKLSKDTETPKNAECYKVTYNTTQDGLLGPIVLYLCPSDKPDGGVYIEGVAFRE